MPGHGPSASALDLRRVWWLDTNRNANSLMHSVPISVCDEFIGC